MYVIAIGYPLEIKNYEYDIEIGNGIQTLNYGESAIWISFNGVKNILDFKEGEMIIARLVQKGALKMARTLVELFYLIEHNVTIRQGAGTIVEDGNIICFGDKKVSLKKLDFEVWRMSNGRMTIQEIWSNIRVMFNIRLEDFLKSLSLLDEMDLIFLR